VVSCGFPTNTPLCILLLLFPLPLSHSCYMPCPSHSHPPCHPNYTWRRVCYEASIYAVFFNLLSFHFSSDQIFSSVPCSQNTLSLYSLLNVRDLVLHPYRTAGKIIVLKMLIFTFLDSRREDKKLLTECNKYCRNPTSS
jgi:hypothetical protein